MERRSRPVWWTVLLIVMIVSLIPQIALAMDGVQDSSEHSIDCTDADFGDLPDTYHTTYASNGPYHDRGSLRLGANFDWETTGTPSDNALGDDDTLGVGDDEDGVDFAPPVQCAGSMLQFTVTVTGGGGTLGAWFDWNQNGYWDLDSGEGMRQSVSAGENTVTVVCPVGFNDKGVLNARFRLYEGTPSSVYPWGGVYNGEVEDYTWAFGTTAVRMAGFAGEAHFASLQGVASVVLVATAAFGLGETRRRYLKMRAN